MSVQEKMKKKIYTIEDVAALTGFARVTLWRMIKRGEFPANRKFLPGVEGWLKTEIDHWIAEVEARVME